MFIFFFIMYLEKTLKKFHQTNRKSLRAQKPPATTKTKTAQQPKWKRKKKVEMGEKKQKPANEKRLFEKGFSNCPHTKCPVVQQQKQQTVCLRFCCYCQFQNS